MDSILYFLFNAFIVVCAFVLMLALVTYRNIGKFERWKPTAHSPEQILITLREFAQCHTQNEKNLETSTNHFASRLLVSCNVDKTIEGMVDLCLRDYLFVWYKDLVEENHQELSTLLKNEFWLVLSKFVNLFNDFDDVSFVASDLTNLIHTHFKKITTLVNGHTKQLTLDSHLESKEKEIEYLRRITTSFLGHLLPVRYVKSQPVLDLLTEIIAIHVLYNVIEFLSDPDFINMKIIVHIKSYQHENDRHRRTYAYAETYEDFIRKIQKCHDVESLKKIRYYCVSEIIEATAVNEVKREMEKDQRSNVPSTQAKTKGSLYLKRDLERYINQLTYAKKLCSKRITEINNRARQAQLMGTDRQNSSASTSSNTKPTTTKLKFEKPLKKTVLPFAVIISSDFFRRFFRLFLENSLTTKGGGNSERTAKHLIDFYASVEQIKEKMGSTKQYEIANDLIKHSYFLNSINSHIKLSKEILKGMEAFIKGDKGPESFIHTQSLVYTVLQDRYYPLFIVSNEYGEMLDQATDDDLAAAAEPGKSWPVVDEKLTKKRQSSFYCVEDLSQSAVLTEHINLVKTKLSEVLKKKSDKEKALHAARGVQDVGNSRLRLLLAKAVKDLEEEIGQMEGHIRWSEQYVKYLGKWNPQLHAIQFYPSITGDTKRLVSPLLNIIIQLDPSVEDKSEFEGWVIERSINEVIELKRKLVRINPALKKFDVLRLKNVSERDAKLISSALAKMQALFDGIIADESCCKSEDLFFFFCPSHDSLRASLFPHMYSFAKFDLPFASLFGINSNQTNQPLVTRSTSEGDDDITDLLSIFDDETMARDDNIAEPLYSLLTEVFGLKGVSGLLRKTLIVFVQLTYGQTINKQLRETVSWIFSEPMIYYYLSNFREAFWPKGEPTPPADERSKQHKDRDQFLAKKLLLDNIPDILNSLLGHQNCRKGFVRVFDYLQNQTLNKQLIYSILKKVLDQISV